MVPVSLYVCIEHSLGSTALTAYAPCQATWTVAGASGATFAEQMLAEELHPYPLCAPASGNDVLAQNSYLLTILLSNAILVFTSAPTEGVALP
jgi:hypothetical protein